MQNIVSNQNCVKSQLSDNGIRLHWLLTIHSSWIHYHQLMPQPAACCVLQNAS